MIILRKLSLILILFALTACEEIGANLAGERFGSTANFLISGTKEWQGDQAITQGLTFKIAKTENQWQELWAMTNYSAPAPLPDGAMAVAIFLGQRPSGGYAVQITDIRDSWVLANRDERMITYTETKPKGAAPAVITSPYVIRLMPASNAIITFNRG